jgi:integrase
MTISSAFDLYADLQSTYVSPKTIRDVYKPTKNALLRFLGDRPIEEITPTDLVRWVQHELREKKREPRGVNISIRTVRAFGNFLAKQKILPRENPFSEISTLRVEFREAVCISPEDFGKIYESEPEERYRLAFLLAYHTGLRRTDVAHLSWKNVHLDHEYIRVIMGKTRRVVVIPMTPVVRELLLYQHNKTRGTGSVWGTPIPSDKLGKHFKDACRRAGFEDYHFAHLRSSFASHLSRLKVPPERIARLMGHTSLALVYSTYTYIAPEEMTGDVAMLPVSTGSVAPISTPTALRQPSLTGSRTEDSKFSK